MANLCSQFISFRFLQILLVFVVTPLQYFWELKQTWKACAHIAVLTWSFHSQYLLYRIGSQTWAMLLTDHIIYHGQHDSLKNGVWVSVQSYLVHRGGTQWTPNIGFTYETNHHQNHLPWLRWLFVVHIRTLTNRHFYQPFFQISIYSAHRPFKIQMMATSVHWNVGCISTNLSQTWSQYSTLLQILLLMSHLPCVLFTDIILIQLYFLPNYDFCTLGITAFLF